MAPTSVDGIWSATYSGVPVFEFNIEGNHVMRRRHDDYINATHILKVADYDKPARTRILEREVQKGVHEKIQGGYGKYQGTWVPLKDGRFLAERNNVLDKLRPIFDYIHGDVSPPPAPKHTTNSNKPKVPKAPNVKKVPKPKVNHNYAPYSDDYYDDQFSNQLNDDDDQDNSTIATASYMEEDDGFRNPSYPNSRKRKRGGPESIIDQQHMLYADNLLDYFILSASEEGYTQRPPVPPAHFDVDRTIDDQGHTALHWAAAMGDIDLVEFFLQRGAKRDARNARGETPLIRSVLFTNNFEKKTMPTLVHRLRDTLEIEDWHGGNVLHHIAMTLNSSTKKKCAREYLDVILDRMADKMQDSREFSKCINHQDFNGDTPLHIVARNNTRRCFRALQGRGARTDIRNREGQTTDQILQLRRPTQQDFISSSPPPAFGATNGNELVKAPKSGPAAHYNSQAARSFSQSFTGMTQDRGMELALAYDSEVREKDDDLTQGQRLQQAAENERTQVRQLTFTHFAADGAENWNEEEVLRMQDEERHLQAEGESLSEQIQHKELHKIVRAEETRLPRSERPAKDVVQAYSDTELEAQRRAAVELGMEQERRKRLTEVVVVAQGAAGMGERGEKLKRLVASTCAVAVEDVPVLAPELLEELRESKMEVDGGTGGGGIVAVV